MPRVTFHTSDNVVAIDVDPTTDLHRAAIVAGVWDSGVCGRGSCGLCRVDVIAGGEYLSAPTPVEKHHLGTMMHLTPTRLSCQLYTSGDVELRIED